MSIILITGASTGFGRALATTALARGHVVALGVRNPEHVADLVEQNPDRAFAVRCDLTKPADPARAVEETMSRFGRIDVLINNAGYGHEGAVENISIADFRRLFDANFFGAGAMAQAVLPHMIARQRRIDAYV